MSERTYFWGNIDSHAPARDWHRITTREESRMISGGTTGLRTWYALSHPRVLSTERQSREC